MPLKTVGLKREGLRRSALRDTELRGTRLIGVLSGEYTCPIRTNISRVSEMFTLYFIFKPRCAVKYEQTAT